MIKVRKFSVKSSRNFCATDVLQFNQIFWWTFGASNFSFFSGKEKSNLVVILVVILQKKMRNSTNFFFTNLAFSDLCVGLFCIFQDLSSFLQPTWSFGVIMCKMYHFTQTMSYTASIFTMVIISIERYIAICYPIRAKKVLQMRNFRLSIAMVWILSAIICAPNLWMYGVIGVINRSGGTDEICMLQKLLYNIRFFNVINALLLFLLPMILMSFLYIRLGLKLKCRRFETQIPSTVTAIDTQVTAVTTTTTITTKTSTKTVPTVTDPKASDKTKSRSVPTSPTDGKRGSRFVNLYKLSGSNGHILRGEVSCATVAQSPFTTSKCLWSKKGDSFEDFKEEFARSLGNYCNHLGRGTAKGSVINSRRRVIRLLVVVVLTFALCHFPIHLRKLIQDWYTRYQETSVEGRLATIVTNMLMYINSGLNPILYALLSSKFRKSLRGLC
uniref:G-protein coupled receptors family 1 profile domain-containing protein n=1 Tax=Tetranychus urticae TaxID=32264 RepID=T1K4P3_TETUR